jgi:hypothetical protein
MTPCVTPREILLRTVSEIFAGRAGVVPSISESALVFLLNHAEMTRTKTFDSNRQILISFQFFGSLLLGSESEQRDGDRE